MVKQKWFQSKNTWYFIAVLLGALGAAFVAAAETIVPLVVNNRKKKGGRKPKPKPRSK